MEIGRKQAPTTWMDRRGLTTTKGKENVMANGKVKQAAAEVNPTATRELVPTSGVFGELDNQLRSYLAEVAIDRMNLSSDLVRHLKEENRIIKEMCDVASNRVKNLQQVAKTQGLYQPVDNSTNDDGGVE